MRTYRVKTPSFLQRIFPKRIWRLPNAENSVYLTFDDGPIPEVTPWVLDMLKSHNAKATFFCIGDNVRKHPEVFNRLASEGHGIGNHTYHHVNGWKTATQSYIEDSLKAEAVLGLDPSNSKLFRPPYGKIKMEQSKSLRNLGYNIIMWDVLSADFDRNVSKEECLENVLNHLSAGSIVVFHDSLKAEKRLKYALPKVLEHIEKQGWNCKKIAF